MERVGMETVNRLIWGVFLVAIGALLLAVNLGFEVPGGVWNYWPFLLIAMGAAKIVFASDGETCGGGFWLLLAGLYGWISIWHIWGLSWSTAWPIFVIAGGLSVVFQPAFSGRGWRGRRARRGRWNRMSDGNSDSGAPATPKGVDHVG